MSDAAQVTQQLLERVDRAALAVQAEPLSLLMQELAGVAGSIADAHLRERIQLQAQRWSSARAIGRDLGAFRADVQELANGLHDAGLM